MHDPREPHLAALKCILRYVHGTLHMGLFLRPSPQSNLVVYSNVDWLSWYVQVYLRLCSVPWWESGLLIIQASEHVSHSNAKAKYWAVANTVTEASWLRQLLSKLYTPLHKTSFVYCDNINVVYMSS